MKIRSITCFCSPLENKFPEAIRRLSAFVNALREDAHQIGWEIQTARLSTIPFGIFTNGKDTVREIQSLEKLVEENGFTYLSIGPARLFQPAEYAIIPEILAATKNVFLSGALSHPRKGISMEAVRQCAKIITQAAGITADGFTNLRFCAVSGVQPFTPFFPASYSYGPDTAFAFAMEAADAAVSSFNKAKDVNEGRSFLLSKLEAAAADLGKIARKNARIFNVKFKGFDFSLAPFPEEWCSIGSAMEKLGVRQLGMMGSLTSAAILAEILDRGNWPHVGFNGVMLPVLEDFTLAARSQTPIFSIKDLLMFSSVCGTGLDTVPLPGDISAEAIASLLMDVAALSLRLNKPLTARLMPVPGLKSGEQTRFDFEFFRNGGVMDFPADKIGGLLENSKWVEIRNRYS